VSEAAFGAVTAVVGFDETAAQLSLVQLSVVVGAVLISGILCN
jgi:hypothetical protein